MEIKIPELIEVIEFNIETRQRRIHRFDEYYKMIGFLKRQEDKIKLGFTYTICDIGTLGKINLI